MLNLVSDPDVGVSESEPFSFRRAVVFATLLLLGLATGASYWLVSLPVSAEEDEPVSVSVRSVEEEASETEARSEVAVVRSFRPPPVAPRTVGSLPSLPAVSEELIDPEWEETPLEPFEPLYDLSELDQEENEEPKENAEKRVAKQEKASPKRKPNTGAKPRVSGTGRTMSTTPPVPLKTPKPHYPLRARQGGIEGRVVLDLEVRADGRVGSVRVVTTSGSPILDSAAIAGVKRWRFRPATAGGRPVSSKIKAPVNFGLR